MRIVNTRFSSADVSFFLIANFFVLAIVAFAYALELHYPDFYYFSIQEDEYLEWASFWAFLLASVACVRRATDYRHTTSRFPWFLLGLALFCFIVAMEEISWGQRVLGYRPPAYFLANNFQQEFNFHNIVDTDYRKLALTLVIAVYGIVLPLAARFAFFRTWFARVGIIAPTIALLPAFAAALVLYVMYPWSHSGEWVELMLGIGFLFSTIDLRNKPVRYALVGIVAVTGLGLMNGALSRSQRNVDPANLEAARIEVAAIASDFESGLVRTRCSLHKRLYTFVEQYQQDELLQGGFAALQSQGLPQERAEFFLDPWNSPYWLRDRCSRRANTRLTFIYSFGPNRRRDSSRTEILGDDIGMYINLE